MLNHTICRLVIMWWNGGMNNQPALHLLYVFPSALVRSPDSLNKKGKTANI